MSSNTIYKHKHHIIPKHQRGVCPLLDLIINDKSNLIALTVPEHAEAHKKLYEEFGNEYDRLAWQGLLGIIGKEEIVRLSQIENGKKSRGRKFTEEHKKNLSLANKGKKKPKSPCHRCGMLVDAGNMPQHLRRKVPCLM